MIDRLFCPGTPAFPPSRKRALRFFAAFCVSIPTLACADTATVRRPDAAARIVSLVPSATDVLLELGVASRIVGRTDYDGDVRIARVVSFGHNMRASTEAIVAQDPDLVIDASYMRWEAPHGMRERARIATFTADVQTFADVLELIDTLGALVGERRRAAALRAALEGSAADMRAAEASHRQAVLYLVWPDPPRTISSTSYLNEIIELAGARNVFPELTAPWPEVSLEVIVQRDPEYIVIAADEPGAAERLRQSPLWNRLGAVAAGRVIEVPVALFHRPGPRIVEAAQWLRDALGDAAGGT